MLSDAEILGTVDQRITQLRNLHHNERDPAPDRVAKVDKGYALLDYVGHADVTDILLQYDPLWYWEPPSLEELERLGCPAGAVLLDAQGNPWAMWVALVVCGHRRLGFGTTDKPAALDAIKVLIGDAIRNAAMRFGVALALWSKAGES